MKSATALIFSLLYSYAAYILGEPWFRLFGRRKKVTKINLAQVERVLVIRLDEIGDVVISTPLLRELRRNLPKARISLLVNSVTYNLVEHCPYVDEILNSGPVAVGGIHVIKVPIRSLRVAAQRLWSRRFDLAIIPRWDEDVHQATFTGYFSGAPLRLGYSEKVNPRKSWHNKGHDRLLTHAIVDTSVKHELEHNLDILKFLGGKVEEAALELWDTERDNEFAEKTLREASVEPGKTLIAFCPGAAALKRTWPVSGFFELGRWLQKRYNAHIVVIGGPNDRNLGRELYLKIGDGITDVTGRATLRQTYSLLKRAHLYVGGDTGPMHMAAAAGIPVIEISCHPKSGVAGSVNAPGRLGPWVARRIIIQPETPIPPCSAECSAKCPHCITQITVDELKEAVEKLFSGETFQLSELQVDRE